MNLRVISVAFVMFVIGLSAVCEAQGEEGERIVEIWTCTLNAVSYTHLTLPPTPYV